MLAQTIIKQHEGLSLKAYRCPAGVWTIGWGHTRGVTRGQVITLTQAEQLLADDVAAISRQLTALQNECAVTLTDNQRAALISFAFNVGFRALRNSTLWKLICQNTGHPDIRREFMRWKYAGGIVMPGLEQRRAQEADLYLS